MIQSIKITKYIRKFLLNNKELQKNIRPTNIFPLIANANTNFPYIVMQRTGVRANYSKAGLIDDNVTIEMSNDGTGYVTAIDKRKNFFTTQALFNH